MTSPNQYNPLEISNQNPLDNINNDVSQVIKKPTPFDTIISTSPIINEINNNQNLPGVAIEQNNNNNNNNNNYLQLPDKELTEQEKKAQNFKKEILNTNLVNIDNLFGQPPKSNFNNNNFNENNFNNNNFNNNNYNNNNNFNNNNFNMGGMNNNMNMEMMYNNNNNNNNNINFNTAGMNNFNENNPNENDTPFDF
jgi:hypothetical protein